MGVGKARFNASAGHTAYKRPIRRDRGRLRASSTTGQKVPSVTLTSEAVQQELDKVASLISKAATVLGREPNGSEMLGQFFGSIPEESRGEFSRALSAGRNGDVTLPDGSLVLWKRECESCFLFANGSITSMEFTVYSKLYGQTAKASIQVTFGNPFEEEKAEEPNQPVDPTEGTRVGNREINRIFRLTPSVDHGQP